MEGEEVKKIVIIFVVLLLTGCFAKDSNNSKVEFEILDNKSAVEVINENVFISFEEALADKSIDFIEKRILNSVVDGFVAGVAYELEDKLSGFELHIYENGSFVLEEISETGTMTISGSTMVVPANLKDNFVLIFIGEPENQEEILEAFNNIK